MSFAVIDSHIHLDMYTDSQQIQLLKELQEYQVEALISVSNHLASAERTLELAALDHRIYPAFGYHPEQVLPTDIELDRLFTFMRENLKSMAAVGEVGLPYYLRKEKPEISVEPYMDLLESFIQHAAAFQKPIVMHAIYEDAPFVCGLLEKYSIEKAHFHWFKGDSATIQRIVENGYSISVTPDCLYEKEIHDVVRQVPLTSLMVETDGPWPFSGPFKQSLTHPKMVHASIAKIAELHQATIQSVYQQINQNTKRFYLI
ncbi:TatD family hydrolase [Sediminibacillus albus]|uniref:TatD DNase family protein n=1 Tax=Sediminibacillus albus TaxID=407036 RepID=A0A1G9AQN0_9BACI|nr:TatD family hydrolase [Sediminibacillus albus]SDK29547.1 TatD DNase family protein [Sediminibacillus albus]